MAHESYPRLNQGIKQKIVVQGQPDFLLPSAHTTKSVSDTHIQPNSLLNEAKYMYIAFVACVFNHLEINVLILRTSAVC